MSKRDVSQPDRLVYACQAWLLDKLDLFHVPWDGDTHEIFRRLRMYAELTLLAAKCHELGVDRLPGLREGVVTWVATNPPLPSALRTVVMEFPQAFVWAGTIWQSRARLGIATDELRRVIEDLSDAPSVRYFERHVGHEICVYNVLHALGREDDLDLSEAYSRTLVGNNAWDSTSDTVIYYICHDIFFLSDWGTRGIRSYIGPLHQWTSKLHAWYKHLAAVENIDLAAELFIALSYLEEHPDILLLERSALPSLQKSGLPPIPKGQGLGFARPGDDDDLREFFQHYHTVIVCLIAALTKA